MRRYHLEGDMEARRIVIERTMPLVRTLARRYVNRGETLDDLVQVGSVGLIKAVDRFDISRELRFSTFAGCASSTGPGCRCRCPVLSRS